MGTSAASEPLNSFIIVIYDLEQGQLEILTYTHFSHNIQHSNAA